MEEDRSGLRPCQPMRSIWSCTHKGKVSEHRKQWHPGWTRKTCYSKRTSHTEKDCVWPHSQMPRNWSHGGSGRVQWCLGLGDREGTTVKTLVSVYRDSYRQVWELVWGFTAVNVHHTAQNISKELTEDSECSHHSDARLWLFGYCNVHIYRNTSLFTLNWCARTCQKHIETWEECLLIMYEALGSTASIRINSVVVYNSSPSRGFLSCRSSFIAWQVWGHLGKDTWDTVSKAWRKKVILNKRNVLLGGSTLL